MSAHNLAKTRGGNVWITLYVTYVCDALSDARKTRKRPEQGRRQPWFRLPKQGKSEFAVHVRSIFWKPLFSLDSYYVILPDPKSHLKNNIKVIIVWNSPPFAVKKWTKKHTKMGPTRFCASEGHGHVLCFWRPLRQAYSPGCVQERENAKNGKNEKGKKCPKSDKKEGKKNQNWECEPSIPRRPRGLWFVPPISL